MSAAERAPDSRVYIGRRLMRGEIGVGIHVCWRDGDGPDQELPLRPDLATHSTEFEWAYAGSGPAQLALALLADVSNDQTALVFYQRFKLAVVCGLDVLAWTLTARQIRAHLRELQTQAGVAP